MATVTFTVDGDASGALGAAAEVASAVSQVETSAKAGQEAMAAYEAKTASTGSSITGIRSKMSDAFSMTTDFLTVAAAASGASDSLASKAGEAVGAIGRIAMATASVPGPAGIVAGLLQTAVELIPILGIAKQEMSAVQVAAAEAKAKTELYAKDAMLVFSGVAGEAGASRAAVNTTISDLVKFAQTADDSSDASIQTRQQAASMAAQLFEAIERSDEATIHASKTATAFDLLQASQSTFLGRASATIGSLNEVAAAAERAGQSFEEYQSKLGTQEVSAAPANLWQFAPGKAAGGPVSAGHAYIVGEHHSELFVPKEDGQIVPDFTTVRAPGNTNVYITVNGVDELRKLGADYGIADLPGQVRSELRRAVQEQIVTRGLLVNA